MEPILEGSESFNKTAVEATRVFGTPPGGKEGPRMATAEEKEAHLLRRRSELNDFYESLKRDWDQHQSLHPPHDEQPSLISLTELYTERIKRSEEIVPTGLTTDSMQTRIQERINLDRNLFANLFFVSQIPFEDAQKYLNTFSKEDHDKIEAGLLDRIRDELQNPWLRTEVTDTNDEFQLGTDPEWLTEWKAHYPQLNEHRLIDRIGNVLKNTRVFGRSAINFLTADSKKTKIAEFAVGAAASMVTKNIARELFINTVGGAATGLVGRVVIGGAAGAIVGAGKEYVKQVRGNFKNFAEFEAERRRQRSETEPWDTAKIQELDAQKKHFVERFKPTDTRAIGKAALRGAVFGAIGAGVASVVMDLWEAGQMPGIQGIQEAAGNLGHAAGETLGNAGRTAGDLIGGAGNAGYPNLEGFPQLDLTEVTEAADQVTPTPNGPSVGGAVEQEAAEAAAAKEQALGALTSNREFLVKIEAAVGEQLPQSNLVVDEAIKAAGIDPSQLSTEAYEKIRTSVRHQMETLANEAFQQAASSADNIDPAHLAEIAQQGHNEFVASLANPDTQQQLLKSASEALTDHLTAVEQAIAHAQSALDNFGDSIPLPAGSNPWEVSAGILKQMGVVNPSPEQIMQLDKIICQESGISVPEWGIPGAIDAHQLPVGFNINLTDTVKKTALDIASRK